MEKVELGVGTPAVIGRNGARVKELEREHGVKINVRSDVGVCRIVGSSKAVGSARDAIQAIIAPMLAEEANMKKAVEMSATGGDAAWQAPVFLKNSKAGENLPKRGGGGIWW